MVSDEKAPEFKVVTYLAPGKKRVSPVQERALQAMLKGGGKKIEGEPRIGGADQALQGIYLLPQQTVLEVYQDAKGKAKGFLFANLDVWLSYTQRADDPL